MITLVVSGLTLLVPLITRERTHLVSVDEPPSSYKENTLSVFFTVYETFTCLRLFKYRLPIIPVSITIK